MTTRARFDKEGRRLPDTGRGCGCRLCEEANAPRYERRGELANGRRRAWPPLLRRIVLMVRELSEPVHKPGTA